ncbi:hypothetical protein BJ546DRAFT_840398 [Cryomyces antarcticus]
MEHRGHREVSVQVSGVQRGLERFPFGQGHEDESPPVMCRWRCNLVHNLYFVAYSDEIWVYQPQFPTQALPKEPSFIFKLPLSTPGLPGYLDPQNPHGINNLVIGFLGNEEIIAVACDDGDVIAHYTQDFNDAVERRQNPDFLVAPPDDPFPVFFHANVGMSAWGLAIHTEARMIAVSANSEGITVFAFALAKGEESEAGSPDFNNEPKDWLHSRSCDSRILLSGPRTNRPCIAFCNTGDDPEGRWLLSCTIDGHTGRRYALWQTSYSRVMNWTVMWLDRRSFQRTQREDEATGCSGGPGVSNLDDEERTWEYWDISDSRTAVKDSSVWYGNNGRPLPDGHEESLYDNDNEDENEDEDEDGDDDEEDDEEEEEEEEESVMGGYPGTVGDLHERPEDFRSRVYVSNSPSKFLLPPQTSTLADGKDRLFLDDDRVCDNKRRPIRPVPKLPCPLLFTSVADIYLLQPCSNPDEPASCSPIVALADSLYQKPSEHTSRCNVFDRFNLSAQIPDLGVVVLASQKGRVAVLALTQVQTQVSEPRGNSLVLKIERTVFAYRLERILPFHSQEKAGQRPNAPLLGVAVGPIQGTAGEGRTRRWRLMLHYLDYTVLSYEIGKGRDDVLGVQNLIV